MVSLEVGAGLTAPDMKRYGAIFFDFDGTLSDTSEGVFGSVRYVERSLDLEPLDESQLPSFVGPPPGESYMLHYGMSREESLEAARLHREFGRAHAAEMSSPYPGIEEVLRALKGDGIILGVATLKSQGIVDGLVASYGWSGLFDVVVGMDDAETMTKARAIAQCLAYAEDTSPSRNGEGWATRSLFVGDSMHDARGAAEVGVDFAAALWGFGFSHEGISPDADIRYGLTTPQELLG